MSWGAYQLRGLNCTQATFRRLTEIEFCENQFKFIVIHCYYFQSHFNIIFSPALSGCGFFLRPVNDQGWYFHPKTSSERERERKWIVLKACWFKQKQILPGGVLFVGAIGIWFADQSQPFILLGNKSHRPSHPSKSHKRPDVQIKLIFCFSIYDLKKSNFSWSSNETVSMQRSRHVFLESSQSRRLSLSSGSFPL